MSARGRIAQLLLRRSHPGSHLVDRQCAVSGVVDAVANDLAVGLLWLVPVDDGCRGAQHPTSDLQEEIRQRQQ